MWTLIAAFNYFLRAMGVSLSSREGRKLKGALSECGGRIVC
jgi:hypothetical protein